MTVLYPKWDATNYNCRAIVLSLPVFPSWRSQTIQSYLMPSLQLRSPFSPSKFRLCSHGASQVFSLVPIKKKRKKERKKWYIFIPRYLARSVPAWVQRISEDWYLSCMLGHIQKPLSFIGVLPKTSAISLCSQCRRVGSAERYLPRRFR